MNQVNLENKFREQSSNLDSFWFSHFAMAHIDDADRIYDYYMNSEKVSRRLVVMYCEMWKKYEWN